MPSSSTRCNSSVLRDPPKGGTLSPADVDRCTHIAYTGDLRTRILFYEEMLSSRPTTTTTTTTTATIAAAAEAGQDPITRAYLHVQLADALRQYGAQMLAVDEFRKAQTLLSETGIIDEALDEYISHLSPVLDKVLVKALEDSQQSWIALTSVYKAKEFKVAPTESGSGSGSGSSEEMYTQKWVPTRSHKFPTSLPHVPAGAEEVRRRWEEVMRGDAAGRERYRRRMAIESNHVEGVFLLTDSSVHDLVQYGIQENLVDCLPQSDLKSADQICDIIKDMLGAYGLQNTRISDASASGSLVHKDTICQIHAQLMKTCRFSPSGYIPPGKTRTQTCKTVLIKGSAYHVECCPYAEVDAELEYICRMASQWTRSWRNAFATASWIHLILARCHPFEDGNSRVARIVASIPLIKAGYPPISIELNRRQDYYNAINEAYEGDFRSLTNLIVLCMKDTLDSVVS